MKKYELTEQIRRIRSVRVFRIRTLRDIEDDSGRVVAKAGELGGFVQSDRNLSHKGACWVADDAVVRKDALVKESAIIAGEATVTDSAHVGGRAQVSGKARISGNARIDGEALVDGYAVIEGSGYLSEKAEVRDEATISGRVSLYGRSSVSGFIALCGEWNIRDSSISCRSSNGAQGWMQGVGAIRGSVISGGINLQGSLLIEGSTLNGKISIQNEKQPTAQSEIRNCVSYGKIRLSGDLEIADSVLEDDTNIVNGGTERLRVTHCKIEGHNEITAFDFRSQLDVEGCHIVDSTILVSTTVIQKIGQANLKVAEITQETDLMVLNGLIPSSRITAYRGKGGQAMVDVSFFGGARAYLEAEYELKKHPMGDIATQAIRSFFEREGMVEPLRKTPNQPKAVVDEQKRQSFEAAWQKWVKALRR